MFCTKIKGFKCVILSSFSREFENENENKAETLKFNSFRMFCIFIKFVENLLVMGMRMTKCFDFSLIKLNFVLFLLILFHIVS